VPMPGARLYVPPTPCQSPLRHAVATCEHGDRKGGLVCGVCFHMRCSCALHAPTRTACAHVLTQGNEGELDCIPKVAGDAA
jgi:hypothetical protein